MISVEIPKIQLQNPFLCPQYGGKVHGIRKLLMKKRVEKGSINWETETKYKYLGLARVHVVLSQRYGSMTNSVVRHSVLRSRDDCYTKLTFLRRV